MNYHSKLTPLCKMLVSGHKKIKSNGWCDIQTKLTLQMLLKNKQEYCQLLSIK